ncbi:hypothetical protein [Vibrio splendidus]|uniref:hypothetical protein n=1 Tax=Vibrio splendidus TaxID=29497 RepID=UPI000D393429|nr:hypothetical protein [Vibrio splendidus]PTP52549.1 hypothetical protein CWN83_13505 [Vibrio splendidus]
MLKLRQLVSNKILVASVALTSGSAFAEGSANENAITAAVEAGKGMVSLTTSGVIGIAALGFGLGMVVAWLRK